MAAKYQLITELYRRTGIAVAKNPQAWQGFLSSACAHRTTTSRRTSTVLQERPYRYSIGTSTATSAPCVAPPWSTRPPS